MCSLEGISEGMVEGMVARKCSASTVVKGSGLSNGC